MALNVTMVGEGNPRFVFLHGLFGRGRNMMRIAQGLTGYGSSALYDLPNHGDSDWTSTFSYDQTMQIVVDDIIARFGNQPRLVLAGHSFGGKVAMLAALSEPSLFAGLAVMDIAPTNSAQVSGFGTFLDAMRSLDLSTITSKADAEARLAEQIPQPEVRQFLLTNLRERGGWQWQPNLELIDHYLADIAGWPAVSGSHFEGPTSWMVGQQSAYYRPEDIRLMQRYFPLVRTVVIPAAGHWVHADNPNAVIAAMAELSAASPR